MLDIAFIGCFCVTMIVAPIAWVRMLTAKTQRAYLHLPVSSNVSRH